MEITGPGALMPEAADGKVRGEVADVADVYAVAHCQVAEVLLTI
jgi:hypothetical protein